MNKNSDGLQKDVNLKKIPIFRTQPQRCCGIVAPVFSMHNPLAIPSNHLFAVVVVGLACTDPRHPSGNTAATRETKEPRSPDCCCRRRRLMSGAAGPGGVGESVRFLESIRASRKDYPAHCEVFAVRTEEENISLSQSLAREMASGQGDRSHETIPVGPTPHITARQYPTQQARLWSNVSPVRAKLGSFSAPTSS